MHSRIMPADDMTERAVLGCMLYDEYGLEIGLGSLSCDDFYYVTNKYIFEIMAKLRNENKAVDFVTVSAAVLDKINREYIIELFTNTSTSAGTKSYCNILLDLSYRRRSIIGAEEIINAASGNDTELLDKALENIKNDHAGAVDTENVPTILERVLIDVAEAKKSGKQLSGYATGFYDLDDLISGMEKQKLIVLAGRPAMGKSSAALNISYYIAKTNKDKNVVFFSLEMPKKDIALKLYCSVLNIDNEHFKFNMLTPEELLRISEYTESFGAEMDNFFVEDDPNVSISDIQKSCRNIKNKTQKNFSLIVIDYLQIIRIAQSGNRATDLGEVSRVSTLLAKEFDCPVLLLSQVNRGCEARQNKRPVLSDLKESGQIEQDADTVIFIYRDEVYESGTKDKNTAEFIVAKQRNGSLGTIKLGFRKKTTTFYNLYER